MATSQSCKNDIDHKTSNHYYDLPDDVIEYIESFLKIKPKEVQKLIENPPKKYRVMLRSYYTYDEFAHCTQERIDDFNKEIQQININLMKFFIKYDVKAVKDISYRKAYKHGLIQSTKDVFRLWDLVKSCDHERQFITHDKKHIIISSPYSNCSKTQEEHFKYNFKRYTNNLYNNCCCTYYLILD